MKLSTGNHERKPFNGSLMLYHHLLASDKRCNTKFTENFSVPPHSAPLEVSEDDLNYNRKINKSVRVFMHFTKKSAIGPSQLTFSDLFTQKSVDFSLYMHFFLSRWLSSI